MIFEENMQNVWKLGSGARVIVLSSLYGRVRGTGPGEWTWSSSLIHRPVTKPISYCHTTQLPNCNRSQNLVMYTKKSRKFLKSHFFSTGPKTALNLDLKEDSKL